MNEIVETRRRVPNLNLQALEVFCEVVRQQSFSRGASHFGISQSAVSQAIAHLEGELGFSLFDRRRRPPLPTPEGELYYEGCQELLHDHRSLLERIRRRREGWAGEVRVVAIYSVGLHSLAPSIQAFMAESPEATVQLEYLHPSEIYTAVLNDEADLGVVSYPQPHRSLVIHPWIQERMVLACPPDHPLSGQRSLSLTELDGENFVAYRTDLKIRREIDRALKASQVRVRIVSEFDNIETIKQALEVHAAVSILPRPTIQREVERGTLLEIEIENAELERPVGIVQKRRRDLPSGAARFLETLQRDAAALPPEASS